MKREVDTEFQIETLAQKHDELMKTEVAKRGDLSDAIKAMDPAEKDRLIFEFLKLAVRLDDEVGYILGMIDDYVEGTGDAHLGFVIAQAAPSGAFNKWAKVIKGTAPIKSNRALAGWCVYETWAEAKFVLDAFDPKIKPYNRIYPVVCIAGMEPRTTEPRS